MIKKSGDFLLTPYNSLVDLELQGTRSSGEYQRVPHIIVQPLSGD